MLLNYLLNHYDGIRYWEMCSSPPLPSYFPSLVLAPFSEQKHQETLYTYAIRARFQGSHVLRGEPHVPPHFRKCTKLEAALHLMPAYLPHEGSSQEHLEAVR